MKILFVIHGFLPFSTTGVENYTYTLAKALNRSHKVLVYTARFEPLEEKYKEFQYSYNGIDVKGFCHDSVFREFRSSYSDSIADERFSEVVRTFRPDVVHFQHLIFHSVGYAKILKENNIPAVLTVHDFYYCCPNLGQRLFLGRFRCRERIPIKCALCFRTSKINISAVDKSVYQKVKDNKVVSQLSSFLPEISLFVKGLRLFSIHPTLEEIISREQEMLSFLGRMNLIISPSVFYQKYYQKISGHHNIVYLDYGFEKKRVKQQVRNNEILTLGFVGTISHHKGAHLLIELARRIPGKIRILVWGNDKNDRILSKRLKSLRNVEYRGEFLSDEKAEVYKSIDYLIVPSVWEENSPLVIHEALIHNTPVIASKRGGNPELVKEGVNGFLFEPDEKDSLLKLVERIIRNKIFFRKVDNSVVMDISEHTEKIVRFYRELLI
ncbi:MAG: glycosyltransferase [Deltaproteobacteria bacterium]|nr:glycosyltransferase [Deltaproteobacteria bacterium]